MCQEFGSRFRQSLLGKIARWKHTTLDTNVGMASHQLQVSHQWVHIYHSLDNHSRRMSWGNAFQLECKVLDSTTDMECHLILVGH